MKKILIIDDDPQFVDIINFELKKFGYSTDIASNQNQALNFLSQNIYNLILLDVFLPNKDQGLNLLKYFRQTVLFDEIPIVLITSMPMELFKQEENLASYLEMVKMLISKNEKPQHIVTKIKEILG